MENVHNTRAGDFHDWGCTKDKAGNWVGENYLGRTLMQVRAFLGL